MTGNQTPRTELIPFPEACAWLGVSETSLEKWIDCKIIGFFQASPYAKRYVLRSEIQEKILKQPQNGAK